MLVLTVVARNHDETSMNNLEGSAYTQNSMDVMTSRESCQPFLCSISVVQGSPQEIKVEWYGY